MPGRIKVKMCGMRQAEDIEHAIALGVDALGFIFSPESSRQVSVELVKKLLTPAP